MVSMTRAETSDVRIYLDHAATTPLHPEVARAMEVFYASGAANPSSMHTEGVRARDLLEEARASILESLGAEHEVEPYDLVFTSGGTEANQSAFLGSVLARDGSKPAKIITSAVEHPSILEAEPVLARLGARLEIVPVGKDGRVDPAAIESAIDDDTALVSVMAANNEIGVTQPVEAISSIARANGVPCHADSVQALVSGEQIIGARDLVSLSAHKVGGPKGIGALLIRRGTPWSPLLRGGQQEGGLRAGTENIAGAIAFAKAVELVIVDRPAQRGRLGQLRSEVRRELVHRFPDAQWNTPESGSLPHILSVWFPGVNGESLVQLLDHFGVAASTGSACNVGAKKASHVLAAMGRSDEEIRGAIRLSFGRANSSEQIPEMVDRIGRAVEQLRAIAGYPARGSITS